MLKLVGGNGSGKGGPPGRKSPMADPAFRKKMCERVIVLGREGKSPKTIAAEVKYDYRTLKRWCEDYPDFNDAWLLQLELAQAWYEETARVALEKREYKFPANLWIRIMCARYRDEYANLDAPRAIFAGQYNKAPVQLISSNMTPQQAQELYAKALEQEAG
jgi:hypothetical protein